MGLTTFIEPQQTSRTSYTEVDLPFEEINWLGGGLYTQSFTNFPIITNSISSSIIIVDDAVFPPPIPVGATSSIAYYYTASLELQEHISASSNVVIPIKLVSQITQAELNNNNLTKICVGESSITDLLKTESLYTEISSSLQTEEFLIYGVTGSILAIIANDAAQYPATYWGVCELLERLINVKWIYPSNSGRYYDSKSTIGISSIAYTWRPRFAYRQIAQYVSNNNDYNTWLTRHRIPLAGQGAPSTNIPNKGACLANVGFNDWYNLYGEFVLNDNSASANFNKVISVPSRVDAVIKDGRYNYFSSGWYDPRFPKGISIFDSASILNNTASYLNSVINDPGITARGQRISPLTGAGNALTPEYYSNIVYFYEGPIDTGSNGSMIGRYGYPGIRQYPQSGSHYQVVKSYNSASGFYSSSWNNNQTPRNVPFTYAIDQSIQKFNQNENFQELLVKHWVSGSTVIPISPQRGEFNPVLGYVTINAPKTDYFFMADTDGVGFDLMAEDSYRPAIYTSSLGAYIESGSSRVITFQSSSFLDTTTFSINSGGAYNNRTVNYVEWWITASQNINSEAKNVYGMTSSIDFGVLAYSYYRDWPDYVVPEKYKNSLNNFYVSVVTNDIRTWDNWKETGAGLFWRPNLWYQNYTISDWSLNQSLLKAVYKDSVGFAIDSGPAISVIVGHQKYILVRSFYKEKTSEEFLLEWAQYFTPNKLTDYNIDKTIDPVVELYDYIRNCRNSPQARSFEEIFGSRLTGFSGNVDESSYIPRTKFLISPVMQVNYFNTSVQYSLREGIYRYPLFSSKPQEVTYNQLKCIFKDDGNVITGYPNYTTNPNTLLTSESFDIYYTLQDKYNVITSSAYAYGDPTYISRSLWLYNGWRWQERRVEHGNRVVPIGHISGTYTSYTPYNDTGSAADYYIPLGNYEGEYYSNVKYPDNTSAIQFITTESAAIYKFIQSGSQLYPQAFGSRLDFANASFGDGFNDRFALYTPFG